MSTIGPITAEYIPLYLRIGELSPAERDTADLLVAHEEALRDFARAEVDGDPARSLEPITALAQYGLSHSGRPPRALAGRIGLMPS